jgi:glycerol 3-phosphatase-2
MSPLLKLQNLGLPEPDKMDADSALAIYEALRPILPDARPGRNKSASRLVELLDEVDGLILDGFGVINIGMQKIAGIDEVFEIARQKNIAVLTNGASHPSYHAAKKYQDWGLPLDKEDVISSRDALERFVKEKLSSPENWMALGDEVTPPSKMMAMEASSFAAVEGFAMLGSTGWSDAKHHIFEESLAAHPRPILIGNPDVTAPNPDGFTTEPGYWIARALQRFDVPVHWFGKPHPLAFELAYQRLCTRLGKTVDKARIAMVGDSLHTDILGGAAFGLKTVLVTSYGLLRDHDCEQIIAKTGIVPDWKVARL